MRIDLNADVGESFGRWRLGDDEAILDVVTSANVACGFHAGDPLTLSRTVASAVERGISIGAQVSYRDLAGFGRRFLDASADELSADVLYQIGGLDGICRRFGTRVGYVKPHGALYNAIVHHDAQAAAVVAAVVAYDPGLAVVGLPGSVFLQLAEAAGLRVVREGFADRRYLPDGTLQPRREEGSVLTTAAEVSDQASRLTRGTVVAADGSQIPMSVDSICVHGDTERAHELALAVREPLEAEGVEFRSFVP